ncbi:proteobacterial dedicated sortase system histidine kinase [Thalassotalea euphylliae]|uniref:proteobacterial dedicated sortase system histidine kinase n=1 Tax=Thalassotalea euphylliae TaxID=1655234 RepID=UPI00363ABFA5
MSLRIGLRTKLVFLSCFLFTIPWFGYQYVWEMEKYLRYGQEQTLVGTARALATALHDRPNLFNRQASFLASVERGKDLYGFPIRQPIQLDGKYQDWAQFEQKSHFYHQDNIIWQAFDSPPISQQFNAAVGKYDKFLYLFFNVTDNAVVYRGQNSRSIFLNDHIAISVKNNIGEFKQYIVSNKQDGWIEAFALEGENKKPSPTTELQGVWLQTNTGFNVELRIPLEHVGNNIAFSVGDVDTPQTKVFRLVGSANTSEVEQLGTILVPSPEIERIVKGMSNTQSSIWVVDKHQRVLASAGSLNEANGVWRATDANTNEETIWGKIEQNILHPIYYRVLTKPAKDFYDQLYDESHLTGKHIDQALLGDVSSSWRLSTDKRAVILSAAYPIFIDDNVQGAVIVEETTNGIKSLRNKALEQLFTSILAILIVGTLAFFFFASRISGRIRTLRNQAEKAIDEQGKVKGELPLVTTNDEIGDLSRSFTTAVSRLSQYNQYLENLSSRLSHELRTPIAVVRTSLENMSLFNMPKEAKPYVDRAQSGINRLNHIITNMTEATRVEQILQNTEKQVFNAYDVVNGCVLGFRQIYPEVTIEFEALTHKADIDGSPEHFAQLLEKVIANAIDFSSDNQIKVVLMTHKQRMILSIKNKGELLPKEIENTLFDSMVSVRKDEKQDQPHLGLGLFIARLICDYHNGSISAQNTEDKNGVQVSIDIPLD